MAERYGDRYSPGTAPGATPGSATEVPQSGRRALPRRRSKVGIRANLMFLAPAPMILLAFGKDPTGLAAGLAGGFLLLGAAFLTREGLRAEEAYEARSIARRPALPRKILASLLTGLGLALPGLAGGSLLNALIFLVLGAGLHLAAFGLDPLSDKGAAGSDPFQSDRVARAVDEAERSLAEMRAAIARAGDRRLEARVEAFQATAREMFRTVENDPRDLTGARRWLGVYLQGARDATAKFADLYARNRDTTARADYLALLDDLEQGYAERTRKMMLDDRSDLDIEIEVLRDRLAREGVGPGDDAT